jgi:signal transduction histidine kinase
MEPVTAPASILPRSWRKGEFRVIPILLAVCCLSALLSARLHSSSVVHELTISNAIGLTSYSLILVLRWFFRGRLPIWGLILGIPAGFVIGATLASLTGAPNVAVSMFRNPDVMRQPILDTIVVAAVIISFFLYFSHSRSVREALERERRRAAEALHAETAARLALLQAQIEPHFLFNTLANVHSLIEEDPDKASLILEELNTYLRTSLRRTRQPTSTLGEELELVEALLAIAATRLGRRLDYVISAPEELHSQQLPPLLLQPLVENAIRHGIEPAVGGGKIQVDVKKVDDSLELTVLDTGVGLNEESPQGVGLANIRARLSSLYGPDGKLALYANVPHGVIAKLLIPISGPVSHP